MKLQLHSTLAALLLSSLMVGCGGGGSSTDVVLDASYYTNKYGYADTDSFLGRGINMGNYFESPEYEGSWTGRTLERADFELVAAAGFKSVRIPIRWSDHAATSAPYTIDPDFLARVKVVVGWALDEGLNVVVNTHHYNELFAATPATLEGHQQRLHGIWSQLSDAFDTTNYPVDRVVFELLNEPNGAVTYGEWNDMVADLTTLVWTTKNQVGRKIMIGTANWGGPTGIANLTLPTACTRDNTIITIHWYEPFHFTHQGAEWAAGSDAWIGTVWRGTTEDQQPLLSLYDSVTAWNSQAGRGFEIFVGEFGAYAKYAGADYRKAWTAFIAREAEARGMSWAYWEFDQGFGAYDRQAEAWRQELIEALLPADAPPAAQ